MEYKKFVEYIKKNTEYIAGEGGNVTINHVIKNNGCEMDGLVIMEKGKDIAPTIYLEGFYEEYTRGEDIRNIIRQIETVYEENKNNVTFDVNILKQFETIKDKIVYKVSITEAMKSCLSRFRIKEYLILLWCFIVCWTRNTEKVRQRLYTIIILRT